MKFSQLKLKGDKMSQLSVVILLSFRFQSVMLVVLKPLHITANDNHSHSLVSPVSCVARKVCSYNLRH